MNWLRKSLIGLLAGHGFRPVAYWIDDERARGVSGLSSVIGGGAVICLVDALKREDRAHHVFTLDDWEITVRKK